VCGYWGPQFVDSHCDGVDQLRVKGQLRYPLRETLQKIELFSCERDRKTIDQRAIVNRLGEIIRSARWGQIEVDVEFAAERLSSAFLVR